MSESGANAAAGRRCARPPARGACRRPDPRGNRTACRGLRGASGGDRTAAGLASSARSGSSTPGDGRLRCVRTWHAGERRDEFEALSERADARAGRGAPGPGARERRAGLARRRAGRRELPARDGGRRSGLHAGFGFPLRSPRGVVGVMEFFSRRAARAGRAAARDDGARSAARSGSSSPAGGPRRRCARASRGCGRCSRRRSTRS